MNIALRQLCRAASDAATLRHWLDEMPIYAVLVRGDRLVWANRAVLAVEPSVAQRIGGRAEDEPWLLCGALRSGAVESGITAGTSRDTGRLVVTRSTVFGVGRRSALSVGVDVTADVQLAAMRASLANPYGITDAPPRAVVSALLMESGVRGVRAATGMSIDDSVAIVSRLAAG